MNLNIIQKRRLMTALYIVCLGILLMTTDDLYTAKPEQEQNYRDDNGIIRTYTIPAREGGLSATDIGFLILMVGTMLAFCTVVDHELIGLIQEPKK